MEIQHSFLSSLLEQKINDIKLFGKQIDACPSYLQGSVATDCVKSEKMTCVLTHFDELAESYIQARISSCFDITGNNSTEMSSHSYDQ